LSERYADASAATIESAQTGQVGKSLPRGSDLSATVDKTSATAVIVTSWRFSPADNHTLICLTMPQHKCVGFTLFRFVKNFAMQRVPFGLALRHELLLIERQP
jgi:hypothetical protein